MTKTNLTTGLVWFRNDLRLADNPALYEACDRCDRVIGVFIFPMEQWEEHHHSPARIALTISALKDMRERLAEKGIPLFLFAEQRFSDAPEVIRGLVEEHGVGHLFFNTEYAVHECQRDKKVLSACESMDVNVHRYHGSVIVPPGQVLTGQGEPYKVFTPFRKNWLSQFERYDHGELPEPDGKPEPDSLQEAITPPDFNFNLVETDAVKAIDLSCWPATEAEANSRLDEFVTERGSDYKAQRDIPDVEGTSRLSPCLTIGTLSPRQCLQRARWQNQGELSEGDEGLKTWITELIWREFYLHVMDAFPDVSKSRPFRPDTNSVPWRHDREDFEKWCRGETGFPLVDAAMKQLVQTHWMHNRLRMVTAMFLTKYLLIDWRWGEAFFMSHLADGHFASNNGGWQWSASTGTDAAPYFRLLSPVRQAERFDPDGAFVKRYFHELRGLSGKVINTPGHPDLLATGYPAPMIDVKEARERCLAAFKGSE